MKSESWVHERTTEMQDIQSLVGMKEDGRVSQCVRISVRASLRVRSEKNIIHTGQHCPLPQFQLSLACYFGNLC